MSELYVRKELFPIAEDGPSFLIATRSEVLAWLQEHDPARRLLNLTSPETIEKHRDTIDLFVAETLYEEAIAHNVDARGGTAVESDWPSWDDLGEFGRDHWLSMAVAARLSFLAVLRSVEEGTQ